MPPARQPSRWHAILHAAAICLCAAPHAFAGMPVMHLTEMASLRFQTLSFFLVGFLLLSAAVMGLWNGLRRDFPRLPRLGYGRALALVALWGMLFVLILTMISGARELLTPGAWEPHGPIYKLKDHP